MFKKKYTRAELSTLIKDLILAEAGGKTIIGSGQASQQFYSPSTKRNLMSGYYAGAGGQPAVAATILALHNAISSGKNPTVKIEKINPAGYSPGLDEIIIAGIGQNRTADIAFDMSLIGGSGICNLEVKSALDKNDTVDIACKSYGAPYKIPPNHFDASIFVLGGSAGNLQQDVTFCVGSASSAGDYFLKKVFNVTASGNVISDLNGATKPKGKTKERVFSYDDFEKLSSTQTVPKVSVMSGSGNVTITAALMNALAWTTYCIQEPKNLQRATQFAAMVGSTQQEVLDVQCKFDKNGSSCFASTEHGNGRYLPCLPDFTKRPQYKAALTAAWPTFKNNTKNCDYYDFSGIKPSSSVSYKNLVIKPSSNGNTNTPNQGAPINVVFKAKFGKQLQPFLAGKTNVNDIMNAIDAVLDDGVLSASGMITPKGVKDFIKDVGLNLLIELIQYAVTEDHMLKTAIAAVWNAAEQKGLIAGNIPSLKADIFNEIKSIKLSGTNNINVSPGYGAICGLGISKALKAINKYRKLKGWKTVKNGYSLRRLSGSSNFTWHDVKKGMTKQSLPAKYLNETTSYTVYEFKNLIKEVILSDFEIGGSAGSENLPDDFSSLIPGDFIASVDMENLERLAEILKNEKVSEEIFLDSLANIVSENITTDDNNVMSVAPELYRDSNGGEFIKFTGDIDETGYGKYYQIDNQPDEIDDISDPLETMQIDTNQPDDYMTGQVTLETIRKIVRNNLLK